MSATLLRRLAGALLVLLLLSVAAPSIGAAATVEITATATPAVYRVEARGFRDGEEVSAWLTGPSQQVMASGTREADDRGRLSFRLRLPRHVQPGRWAITLHGLTSDREVIGFLDVPLLGPDVTLSVSPAGGAAGTTFRFTSPDFRGGELVSYWLTDPDGTVAAGGRLTAGADGHIDFSYTLAAGATPGRWAMSAAGWESDHYGVASFTVS
jgi:hypothetical protein